jgi:hypothetical protein
LIPEYFEPGRESADVFVMRCVLPHIPQPWPFMDRLRQCHPGSLVLIEFQRLEWILQEHIWYQLSHDHVNLFELADFTSRFDVLEHGSFSAGEWGWVLVRLTEGRAPAPPSACARAEDLRDLLAHRHHMLSTFRDSGTPVIVWGAAGKGTVLVDALLRAGTEVPFAVDADARRRGKYLEGSGVVVRGPADMLSELSHHSLVVVANPNHFKAITERYGGVCRFTTPALGLG